VRRPIHHLEITAHKSFFGQSGDSGFNFISPAESSPIAGFSTPLRQFFLADFYQLRPFLIFGQKRFQRQVAGLHGSTMPSSFFKALQTADCSWLRHWPWLILTCENAKENRRAVQLGVIRSGMTALVRCVIESSHHAILETFRRDVIRNR